jgi:hypothetical protein
MKRQQLPPPPPPPPLPLLLLRLSPLILSRTLQPSDQ